MRIQKKTNNQNVWGSIVANKAFRIMAGILLAAAILIYLVFPVVIDKLDGTTQPARALPNSLLPAGKPALPTQFLSRPGGKIAYDDSKTPGPLVVCVPGIGDLRQEYRFLAPQLAAAGYRVVTMDLRGMGESSTSWSEYSSAAVGTDIDALIQHLHAGPAIVIGDSMAGGAAVWAVADKPDLVKGLVLMDAFVRAEPLSFTDAMLLKLGLARPWGIAAWSMFYKTEYPTSPPADLSLYRGVLKANLHEPGRFTTLQKMMAAKSDTESMLKKVKAPALIVMGTKDPDFKNPGPAVEAHWQQAKLHGDIAMIPGAGHYPDAEMPKQVGPKILAFLKKIN